MNHKLKVTASILILILFTGCSKFLSASNTPTGSYIAINSIGDNIPTETSSFCKDYYGGKVVDGFCYTNPGSILNPSAKNGSFTYTPEHSNVVRTIIYPPSIEIIEDSISFMINVDLKNNGQNQEIVTMSDFRIALNNTGPDKTLPINLSETISPAQTIHKQYDITIPHLTQDSDTITKIRYYDSDWQVLPRIIFYSKNSSDNLPPIKIQECGVRKYSSNVGVCINNTFFPANAKSACNSDKDCQNYVPPKAHCFEYSCSSAAGTEISQHAYRVGLQPIYITNNSAKYSEIKRITDLHITRLLNDLNAWEVNEKEYWNVTRFNLNFSKLGECKLTSQEFDAINSRGNLNSKEAKILMEKCAQNQSYDKYIFSIIREDNFDPDFKDISGYNFDQTSAIATLQQYTIIHELLHTFGIPDLYSSTDFQWGNCYMYYNPTGHLCKYEAMQLGFIPKIPSNI